MHAAPTFPRPSTRSVQRGFILIELMIAVVVAGVLAAIAYPSFTQYLIKSRRGEAVNGLTQIQQAQERWRTNNPSYNSTLSAIFTPATSNPYNFALSNVSGAGYTATATPKNPGSQAGDTQCTTMSITVLNGNATYNATGTGATRCWNR